MVSYIQFFMRVFVLVIALNVSGVVSAQSNNQAISYVTMTFPKNVQWKQSQSKKLDDGGMFAEWVVNGHDVQTTPVRVVYNKVIAGGSARNFAKKIAKQVEAACVSAKVTRLSAVSKYRDQDNVEVLCSRVGQLGFFGTAIYLTVLSDGKAIHVVSSEIKTIPSEKPGFLSPKNSIEQAQVENSKAFISLMEKFRQSIRACNNKKVCY